MSNPNPGPGPGRPRKSPDLKYRAINVKLPPDVLDWLAENTNNRNGFIVEAIREKISVTHERKNEDELTTN